MGRINRHSGNAFEPESNSFFYYLSFMACGHTRLTSQGSTLHGPKGDQQQSPLYSL